MTQNNNKKPFEAMVTPVFRASYAAVFQASMPKGETDEKKAKYGVTMLFDMKNPEVAKGVAEMKAFALRAGVAAWGEDTSKWPHIEHKLFRMGDTPDKKDSDGNWKPGFGPGVEFCKATSALYKKNGEKRMPPGIVDVFGKSIIMPNEFYSGCYARAKISVGTYDYMGKRGISFYLVSLRKENDGEPFVAKHNAADDFEGIPVPAGAVAGSPAMAGGTFPF